MNPKRYYMSLGNSPLSNMGKKTERFIVESKNGLITDFANWSGEVVATNRNTPDAVHMGYVSSSWCNPLDDIAKGFAPSFVPVPASYVVENFETISDSVRAEHNRIQKEFHDMKWRGVPNPPPFEPLVK